MGRAKGQQTKEKKQLKTKAIPIFHYIRPDISCLEAISQNASACKTWTRKSDFYQFITNIQTQNNLQKRLNEVLITE